MLDKFMYAFFGAIDKLASLIELIVFGKKKKKNKKLDRFSIMEIARMNYYFTGLLIVMLVVLAFCGGPHVQ